MLPRKKTLTDAHTRRQYWKKLATGATPEPSTQGSVLLQTWLRLHAPHNQVVLDSCVHPVPVLPLHRRN